jgi:hypothetical protein
MDKSGAPCIGTTTESDSTNWGTYKSMPMTRNSKVIGVLDRAGLIDSFHVVTIDPYGVQYVMMPR